MSTESLKIILDSIKGKIDFQLNADNGIDSKSGILIGLIGVVAVFYLNIKNGYIGYIPFIGLAIASFFLFKLTDPKRYNTGSLDPYDDTKEYRSMPEDKLLNQMISDYQKAFDDNSRISVIFFMSSILLMIILNFL
jgi:hypothetical protein